VALQAGVEAERGQHDRRIELRDVGAVTLARLEDHERGQRSDSLAQRAPRDAPLRGELLLDRRAVTGPQLAAADHPLDLLDDQAGSRSVRAAPGSGMASA